MAIPVALTAFASVGLTLEYWSPLVLLLPVVAAFRIFNWLRIAEGRMHEHYMRRATLRSSLVLGFLQLITLMPVAGLGVRGSLLIGILVSVQLLVSSVVFLTVARNLFKMKHRPAGKHYADKELPTVSVAIPARNETTDLEDCLRTVLASNYPKLEVLVLDDCSHDKTSEIIKSFAHDGVRFVKGYEPGRSWLAKNQAYEKLADEASGELVLFCGVDVRFGPEAIRSLVTTLLNRKKDMISVMPKRLHGDFLAAFIQPMRYWWELALPRRYFNRPAVLSTCWIIRRKKLKSLGGLEAVQNSIIPEGYFARELVKSDGYSFLRADDTLDIQTRKGLAAQRATAIRTRYPELRKRPEWVMLLSLGEVLFLLGPFILFASALWAGFGTVQLLALLACLPLVMSHVLIVQATNPANVIVALVNFPIVIVTELILGYASMFQYEFATVEWKGRNICIPVMRVYPKLPALD